MPPLAVTVALPLQLLFVALFCVVVKLGAPGAEIITGFDVTLQPPASVTVTVYVPAQRLLQDAEVQPLLHE